MIKNYHYKNEPGDHLKDRRNANGLRFIIFPDLNNIDYYTDLGMMKNMNTATQEDMSNAVKQIKHKLREYITSNIGETFDKLIKEGFGGIGLPGGENIKWDYTPTTPTTPGPPPTSYTSAGGGGSSMVTSTGTGAGAGGATTAAGSTTLARNVTSQGTDIASGEVIDWAAIDDVLNLTQPDVINMNEPSITSHIADNASAYTSSSDYFNYFVDISGNFYLYN